VGIGYPIGFGYPEWVYGYPEWVWVLDWTPTHILKFKKMKIFDEIITSSGKA
jgi:hypothetical protein